MTDWNRANPACDRPLRGGDTCAMPVNHRGRHTSVVHFCELCCKWRRGNGTSYLFTQYGYDYDSESIQACFFCQEVESGKAPRNARAKRAKKVSEKTGTKHSVSDKVTA